LPLARLVFVIVSVSSLPEAVCPGHPQPYRRDV
jgi:hypothetical protein